MFNIETRTIYLHIWLNFDPLVKLDAIICTKCNFNV